MSNETGLRRDQRPAPTAWIGPETAPGGDRRINVEHSLPQNILPGTKPRVFEEQHPRPESTRQSPSTVNPFGDIRKGR